MTIFRNIDDIIRDDSTIISVGTFDGVHYAHRQVIKKVLNLASEHGARSFIVTFDPHPQEVLKNKTPDIKLLNTTPEKLKLFEELGIENVLVIKFTHEFSKTTAREFYENLIYSKIGIRSLVVGYDHGFGRGREGDFQMLKKLGEEFSFSVNRVDEIDINSTKVSSTNIRHFLTEGNVENANSLLGYLYSFEAMVIHGDNIGRELGFPTANLTPLTENKVIPGNGVYAVKVELNGTEYNGMMNIGFRPTVSEDSKRVIEVNILDFSAEIYGNKLAVSFVRRLRDEKKFGSKNELIEQIKIDREQTLKILNI
jgi:riboflavin kinase/FMN adenylyltransferase